MAPTPAFFVQLPPDLRLLIVEYLSQSDMGTLLQLCSEVGRNVAAVIHKLEPPLGVQLPNSYRPEALIRLLTKLSSGLRELELDLQDPMRPSTVLHADSVRHNRVGGMLLDALHGGSVGGQLRVLHLGGCSKDLLGEFIEFILKPGLLPLLSELQIPSPGKWDGELEEDEEVGRCSSIPPTSSTEHLELQARLAEALEARRSLGLPPLTRLEGVGGFDPSILKRIWACCPTDLLAYVEADGDSRLEALEERLRGDSHLLALKMIDLGGYEPLSEDGDDFDYYDDDEDDYDDDDEEEEDDDEDGEDEEQEDDHGHDHGGEAAAFELARVIDALARGQTPKLEELSIGSYGPDMGAIGAPLGRAIGEGNFPALMSLSLEQVEILEGDFGALVEGLRANGGLRRLTLGWVSVSVAEAILLGDVLREEKSGLAQLEEIELVGGSWNSVVLALGNGAPCATTLTDLILTDGAVDAAVFPSFLELLGALPALRRFEVETDGEGIDDNAVMLGVPQALLALAKKGTPCRLRELFLSAAAGWGGCVHELGRVFRINGLPCLTALDIRMDSEAPKRGSPGLFDEWKRAGPNVRLEWLSLDVEVLTPATPVGRRFLELLADPAFCPDLRHVRYGARLDPDVDQALEARRNKRDLAARMA